MTLLVLNNWALEYMYYICTKIQTKYSKQPRNAKFIVQNVIMIDDSLNMTFVFALERQETKTEGISDQFP